MFAALVVLQLTAYSYFFTSLVFTNHTFPNSWVYTYPSFKTLGEGRWLADFIIWLQGGSGVQPFQMSVAVGLQSLNGILFARFLDLEKRIEVFLAAACVCLYPAFLDYYSFGMDHITFAIGDTFALLGILVWKMGGRSVRDAGISGLLFVLALASYQPKIALIGLLCACHVARSVARSDGGRPFSSLEAIRTAAYIASVLVGACVVYFLSTKLTITYDIGPRAYLNTVPEMLTVALASYGSVFRYYTVDADYLPRALQFLPALGIGLGCLALLHGAYKKHVVAAGLVAVLLLLMPVALRAAFILNRNSWEDAGRLVSANGYALLFFLCCALQRERLRTFAVVILAALLYSFVVVATHESNAAAFKTIYDLNTINRITSRIETVVEDLQEQRYALVVAGHYPDFARSRYVRRPDSGNTAHVQTFAFEGYRQVEILNYFLGKDVLLRPTSAQVEKALLSAQGRRSWPARESVYILDDVIVVVLERYQPDVPRTSTSEALESSR